MARQGKFDHDSLKVYFGGKLSKPQSIFEADAIKIPTYTYTKREKEALKGGWYSDTKVTNTYTEDNHYVIIKDGVCIGQMKPYSPVHTIKSDLVECNKYAEAFLKKIGVDTTDKYLIGK